MDSHDVVQRAIEAQRRAIKRQEEERWKALADHIREQVINLAHRQAEAPFNSAVHLLKMGAGLALVEAAKKVTHDMDLEVYLLQAARDITLPEEEKGG